MKPRLTLEEHQDLGLSLACVRDELEKRTAQLADAYPRSGPEAVPGKLLIDALRLLESARCELDHMMFREHWDDGTPAVYYPDDDQRATWRPIRRR
jgi:hypothetical protein